ncbi:helix-turn-helix domain-containing protein [Streptomyces sp. NPDC102473]|uniref:helix-turn-helix domain-containing protein n=1 Tax=unclassified Streptomyces TaxID=2593676 RepID=UPI0038218A60
MLSSLKSEVREVLRAEIVPRRGGSADQRGDSPEWEVCVDTVRRWRRRFAIGGLEGLRNARRAARPRVYGLVYGCRRACSRHRLRPSRPRRSGGSSRTWT